MRHPIARQGASQDFIWTPGVGPDTEALARMMEHFPKPHEPMGEAWFMSETRRMFPELLAQEPTDVSLEIVQRCLWEIQSGTCSFGLLPEWDEWFHYLLPRLIPRALETGENTWFGCTLSWLVLAFIAIYPITDGDTPEEIEEPPQSFIHNSLATLGQAIMTPAVWDNGKLKASPSPPAWVSTEPPRLNWHYAGSDFSTAMFFCWKYLDANQIDAWLRSVLRIECVLWRMELVVWLLGVSPILGGVVRHWEELDDLQEQDESIPESWNSFPCHFGDPRQLIPIVSKANCEAFRSSLRRHLSAPEFLSWVEQFPRYDCLGQDLGELPARFSEAFLRDSVV